MAVWSEDLWASQLDLFPSQWIPKPPDVEVCRSRPNATGAFETQIDEVSSAPPCLDRPLARMSARPGNRSLTIPDQTLGGGSWRATMEPVICTVLIFLLSGAACFSEEVVWWSRRNQHSWITWLALILAY